MVSVSWQMRQLLLLISLILTLSVRNGRDLFVRPVLSIPSEIERASVSQSMITATPGTSLKVTASPVSKDMTLIMAPVLFLKPTMHHQLTLAARPGTKVCVRNAEITGFSMPTDSAFPSLGSARPGTCPLVIARPVTVDMTSIMGNASTQNQTEPSQPTVDAGPGTGKAPSVPNVQPTGFSTKTVSVFLSQISVRPQMPRDNATPATGVMSLSTVAAPTLTILSQCLMLGVETGTTLQTLANSARTGGSWRKQVLACRFLTFVILTVRKAASVSHVTRDMSLIRLCASSLRRMSLLLKLVVRAGRREYVRSVLNDGCSMPMENASLSPISAELGIH